MGLQADEKEESAPKLQAAQVCRVGVVQGEAQR